ncbi:MAG: hypothetical protein ACYC91_02685 [Solirubrobacteraceae bacterium]
MPDYSKSEISSRLATLGASLAEFPEGALCPWPVARIFNELVKHARRQSEEDPVLKSIRFLEESSEGESSGMSNALVTTVRALVDQVALSVAPAAQTEGPDREAEGRRASARPAPPSVRRT